MIAKNIFQSWHTTQLNPQIQYRIEYMKHMNPEYKHKIYTDAEIDAFVNENYPGEIANAYNRLNIIVAKVDFWRYLILYKYGGIYLDMDSAILRPLDELIQDSDQAIITAEGHPPCYVQWALIFSAGHPILEKTIKLIAKNIQTNAYPNNIRKMTGPIVYSEAINAIHTNMFGSPIDHSSVSRSTDITYSKESVSYRIYGIDYNTFFQFKYPESRLLYINKRHWLQEEKIKPLLRG